MNKNNGRIVSVCTTCLSLHKENKPNFPVTEDIKEILRCLLQGFDIDTFFQLKPPDKQLKLCEKCHNTIRDMISFKERVLNSFKEFMKYWSGGTQNCMRDTVSAPSSSHTSTGNLLHVKEIEPSELNYTEPDPLQIKPEAEYTENIIDIKEETDIIDINNETFNLNGNVLYDPGPVIPLKSEQEQAKEKNKLSNEWINSNVTPALYSAVGHRNNLVINKVTASNVSQQNSYHNAATKLHNLKHTNSFVINKVRSTNEWNNSNVTPPLYSDVEHRDNLVLNKVTASNLSKQNSYQNAPTKLHTTSYKTYKHNNSFIIKKVASTNASEKSPKSKLVKHITVNPNFIIDKLLLTSTSKNSSSTNSYIPNRDVAAPSNDLNQNTEARVRNETTVNQSNNLNVGNNNSYVYSAATNTDDLENVILSNLLLKKSASENLTNNTPTYTNANSNVKITNNSRTNNTAITHKDYLSDIIFETNNDNLFKRINVDDADALAHNSRKKLKIVKIDYKGNIENVGEAMIKPFTNSAEDTLTAQQQSIFLTTCTTASSVPDPIITQTIENECGIPESDTSATESEEEIGQNKPFNTVENCENGQKKWYIKIVTRDEILKKMEERRHQPIFVNAPYKCESCVTFFPTEGLAEVHKKSVHAQDSEFTCFACHATFKNLRTLNAHYYNHMWDTCMYYCLTCNFETKDVEYMRDHICPNAGCKPLPPKDPKTMKVTRFKSLYYCPKCEFMTTRAFSLVLHYDKQHKVHPKEKCEECGKFYKDKSLLRYHIAHIHRGKRKPAKDPSYCAKCDKWYKCEKSYKIHVKLKHTPRDKKYKCDVCEKELLTKTSLRNHEEFHAAVKAGVKNHKCNSCGKEFYTERMLQIHVRTIHAKKPLSRDHVCEVCGKGFYTRSMLKEHSAMHSDDRPLKCSFCGDTFKYSGALYTHVKLKHKKKKNGEELRNERKTKATSKGKGQMKNRSKRRTRVESSSTEEELVGFTES